MFDLQKIFDVMGPIQLLVVAVLAVMAVASLAVFVERLWTYTRSRQKSQRFGMKAAAFLRANDYPEFLAAAEKEKGNQLASLLGVGMRKFCDAAAQPKSDVTPIELTRRELERQADTISAQLRRGLNVLASVGSTAPFVGLLGTVIGIIAAFQSLDSQGMNIEKLSGAIGEALVVTAFGLMVAIPAVLMFNFLSARADRLELAIDQSRGQFVDHLEAYAQNTGNPLEWAALKESESAAA